MKDPKYNILKQYIQKLEMDQEREKLLLERVMPLCQIHNVLKNQYIESPGPASDGRIWYSPEVVIHCFYYNKKKRSNFGTQIWKRKEVVLFSSSLLLGEDRIHFVQALEPGMVLSISYKEILVIREEFPEVLNHLEQLIIQNDQAAQHRIRLLNEPSSDRIARFEAENSLFCTISSLATKAMHMGISRQGYASAKNNK